MNEDFYVILEEWKTLARDAAAAETAAEVAKAQAMITHFDLPEWKAKAEAVSAAGALMEIARQKAVEAEAARLKIEYLLGRLGRNAFPDKKEK